MMQTFEFVKRKGVWYFSDPGYAHLHGGTGALTAVHKEGLHTLLEAAGNTASRVLVHTSDEPFDGCDELELTRAEEDGLGGYYLLKSLHQKPYVLLMRFFNVNAFFGNLPSRIYLRSEVPS